MLPSSRLEELSTPGGDRAAWLGQACHKHPGGPDEALLTAPRGKVIQGSLLKTGVYTESGERMQTARGISQMHEVFTLSGTGELFRLFSSGNDHTRCYKKGL